MTSKPKKQDLVSHSSTFVGRVTQYQFIEDYLMQSIIKLTLFVDASDNNASTKRLIDNKIIQKSENTETHQQMKWLHILLFISFFLFSFYT
jgi:hypothetical protein